MSQTTPQPVPEAPSLKPDFSKWSRATLEQFAADVNNRNLQLQDDLRVSIDAYRRLLKTSTAHRPEVL